MKINEVMKQPNGTYFKLNTDSSYGKCYLENGKLIDVDYGTPYTLDSELFDINFEVYNPDDDFKLKNYGTNIGGTIYYKSEVIKKAKIVLIDRLDKPLNEGYFSISPQSIHFIYDEINKIFGDLE